MKWITMVGLAVILGATTTADAQQLIGSRSRLSSAPQPEVVPDHFIVELKHGHALDDVINHHGVNASHRYTIINGFAAHLPPALLKRLAADARVKSISPDLVVRTFARGRKPPGGGTTPPCPDTTAAMLVPETVPWGVSRIHADGAVSSGLGVNVAVIDTGIDDCHPDLKPNYKGGRNFLNTSQPPRDDNGHGTHVAGIIAAAQDNGFGVRGVAPNASLWALKVLDASGSGSLSTVVSALDWAVKNNMKVANLSLGAVDFWCVVLGLCGAGTECTAISNAVKAGVTVVVAAGNSADETLFYTPANCVDSLTVTAFENDNTFAEWFSNHSDFIWDLNGDGAFTNADHPIVDLMAPGVNIPSTMPTYAVTLTNGDGSNLNYGTLTGTSMATPHVSGAAALYIQRNPGATPDQVRLGLVGSGECPPGAAVLPSVPVCSGAWPDDPDTLGEPLVSTLGL